jgi:hypothetical protein
VILTLGTPNARRGRVRSVRGDQRIVAFQAVIFGAAAAAPVAGGRSTLATDLGAVAVINAALLYA